MRWVKVFSNESVWVVEQEINAWVEAGQVLIVNAAISEDDEGFRVIVVYERAAA